MGLPSPSITSPSSLFIQLTMSFFGVELNAQINRVLLDIRLTLGKNQYLPNIRTIYRSCSKYDSEQYGWISPPQFQQALGENGIFLKKVEMQLLEKVFSHQGTIGTGTLNLGWFAFIAHLRQPLTVARAKLIDAVWRSLDSTNQGKIELHHSQLVNRFNPSEFKEFKLGFKSKQKILEELLGLVQLTPQGSITYEQFINFYTDLGVNISSDEIFSHFVSRMWGYDYKPTPITKVEEVRGALRTLRFKLLQRTSNTHEQFVLRKIFNEFDTNKKGKLNANELELTIKEDYAGQVRDPHRAETDPSHCQQNCPKRRGPLRVRGFQQVRLLRPLPPLIPLSIHQTPPTTILLLEALSFLQLHCQIIRNCSKHMQATQKDSLGPPSSLLSLVDWEHSVQRTNFPLLTIHSLTLDDNPKYIYLKQLISQYNDDPEPNRPRYQQTFIQKLFKMMSEVSRMEGIQNQLSTLQKIYAWATKEKPVGPDRDQINGKRPQTASSRTKITRPTTAYSKPPTLLKQAETNNRPGTAVLRNNGFEGGKRPQTGTLRKKMVPTQTISQQEVVLLHQAEGNLKFLEGGAPSNFPMVHPQNLNSIDYSKLGFGECEFYTGGRTLYPEEEHPAKKLKDYERKLFQEDEEVEMIDLSEADQKQEEQAAREKLKQLQLSEQKILREIDEANSPEEPKAEGAEEGDNAGEGDNNQNLEGDINVDDIPLEGEEEQPGLPELEEEPEVVDRLRPRLKAYGELGPKEMKHFEKKHYEGGCLELRMARNQKERKDQEDRVMAKLQAQWAQAKGRARSEMKRRAESARIVKKILPDSTTAIMKEKEIESRQNIINFQNVTPAVISYSYGKETRPATAFLSDRSKEREHVIKNSLLNGQIKAHNAITQQEGVFNEVSLVRRGENPKKKTFEEILKEAEERVVRESEGEIEGVKEAFSKNKISFGVNRIAKSITYEEREISEWEGAVSGMTMLKNPFIKVAKKKKKKKRKN